MTTVYFTKPVTSDLRADVLQYIRDMANAQSRMFDGDTLVSPSVGVIRYNTANTRFEKWDGATFNNLNLSGNMVPAGTNTQIQFNDSGVFGGDSDLLWNKGAGTLTIGLGSLLYQSLWNGGSTTFPNGAAGGWASGQHWRKQSDAAMLGAFGMYGSNESVIQWRVGFHESWWHTGEGLTFTVGGNLAIGNAVIPSAWISTRRAFEIGKLGYGITTHTTNNSLTLTANLYEDAAAWKYAASSLSSFAVNIGQNGYGMEVWGAGSGTINTAVGTWTPLMMVNGLGNAGFGVAISAWSTAKGSVEIRAPGHGMQAAAGQVTVVQNTYYDGAAWKYGATDRAWMIDAGSGDAFSVARAPSGTIGTTATFSTFMAINNTGTARFLKSIGLTDYTNGCIELYTASGDAGLSFHNGGANASSLVVGRSSAIFEFLNNPTSSHQQIKCNNVQTTGYIYGLNGNTLNAYGGIAIRGEKGGYAGISFNRGDGTYMFTLMIDAARTYFGIYDEARAVWPISTSAFTSATKAWVVEGNWYCTQNIVAYYSDERLKTKLGRIENAMDKVSQLEGFYYVQNELGNELMGVNHKVQLALSAQDVQKVAPEVVLLAPFDAKFDPGSDTPYSKTGQDYLTVQYERLIPLLVEALKEANERIKILEERHGQENR